MSKIVETALRTVAGGHILDADSADEFMNELMNGRVSPVQTAGLISCMAVRGEKPSEIAGFARAMRKNAMQMTAPAGAIDTCGTGGDGQDTFNISTTVAIVAAAAGIPVAKHGNRAASSRSGSADVLQALGARIDLDAKTCEEMLKRINLSFLFAPVFHPAMKFAAPARKELGFRTIFNILGPLTNPAGARRQVLGVFREDLVETVALALLELGVDHALVVHGADGLDEFSISGPTKMAEVRDGHIEYQTVRPEDVGLERADMDSIRGGTAEDNANIILDIFSGQGGPKRDVVLLNAAAALYVGDVVGSLAEGVHRAERILDSGDASRKLREFIDHSQQVVAYSEVMG